LLKAGFEALTKITSKQFLWVDENQGGLKAGKAQHGTSDCQSFMVWINPGWKQVIRKRRSN